MAAEYYQAELNRLRQLAGEFARAHPALAPQLSGPSADPDVERILEGVAFLTGNIRQKLDDDFPEFLQILMQLIYPHYLRPLPSATIMAFSPKPILKNRIEVPAGTYIDSCDIEGVSCRFRTCFNIDVAPLSLLDAQADQAGGGRSVIELKFRVSGQWRPESLHVYIAGDYPGACDLYLTLLEDLEAVTVVTGQAEEALLADVAFQPMGLDPDEALLPYPGNSFPVYRLLQEYFLLKEKFLFLRLQGLASYSSFPSNGEFALRFYIKPNRRLPAIDKERFLLHAVPAVNLFEHEAEPVLLDQRRAEIPLTPRNRHGGHQQIYQVTRVMGHDRRAGKKTTYRSLGLFNPRQGEQPVYQVIFRQQNEPGPQVFLSLNYPKGQAVPLQETLMVSLICCNGSLPNSLRPGDICRPTSHTSELLEFRNVLAPTGYQHAPTGKGLLWRLLSHLSLNYLPIADIENLRAMLNLYIFSGGANRKIELSNRKRVEGIVDIRVQPSDRLLQGMPMRGQTIDMQVNADHFASHGDLYLFGTILDRLLASFASINCYTHLRLTEANSGEVFQWPARLGNRLLI